MQLVSIFCSYVNTPNEPFEANQAFASKFRPHEKMIECNGEWVTCLLCKASSISMDTIHTEEACNWRLTEDKLILQQDNDPKNYAQFFKNYMEKKVAAGVLYITRSEPNWAGIGEAGLKSMFFGQCKI